MFVIKNFRSIKSFSFGITGKSWCDDRVVPDNIYLKWHQTKHLKPPSVIAESVTKSMAVWPSGITVPWGLSTPQ